MMPESRNRRHTNWDNHLSVLAVHVMNLKIPDVKCIVD